jgi:hypothetical protein
MDIELTTLSGHGYARGLAHGRALGERIRAHTAAWLGALEAAGVGEPRAYVERMLAETDYEPAIRLNAADLLEETWGIADGADLPRPLIFAMQLLDEEWAYRARRGREGTLQKCSSFGIVLPDGRAFIGQNMDLGAYTDGAQALLQIEGFDGAPAAFVFTVAGVIGLMGVNAAGVGVCVNSLPQLPSAPTGVPVAFVVRRLLQARRLDEAVRLVTTIPHATNQHYVIAQAGAVRSFEVSAAGVTEFHPPVAGRCLHTNHPLGEIEGEPESEAARANSVARLKSLTARLSSGPMGLETLQAALSAFDDPLHPVCRLRREDNNLIGFTTGSMIAALATGADVEAWFSAGPPSEGGYRRFVQGEPAVDGHFSMRATAELG